MTTVAMECPRCRSKSVRPPDSDGDYACGLCGERWPQKSAAERDAALSAELAKLREEIDAEPPRRVGRPPNTPQPVMERPVTSPEPRQPVRSVVLEPCGAVWRWLRCTQDLRRELGDLEKRATRAAEHFQNEAREARRGRLLMEKILESVTLRDTTQQPGVEPWHGKGFRMPEGRWSALHDQCIGCGRTDRRHVGHGYCGTCYQAAKKAGAL